MISIIMPYYNKWELTHARMSELYYNMPKDVEIILVNDASTELECVTGVKFWQNAMKAKESFSVRYHEHKENCGFGRSMNDGVKLAKGDVIVLLSNDVIVRGDFTKNLLPVFEQNDKVLIAEQLVDWPGGWNEFEIDGIKFHLPYANGWFLSCTREVWDNLGGFDPMYGRYDFEDVDLSTTALSLGYNLYALNSMKLHHIGGATISSVTSDRMGHTKRNRELYISKWGNKLLSIYRSLHNVD